jgi:hypothetical protein
MCATLGSLSRNNDKSVLELKRLSSIKNTVVVGGASKIFKHCILYAKENKYLIIRSYCDMRWGIGNVYKKLNFVLKKETKYTPHYIKGLKRYRNQSLRKTLEERKLNITEKELRKSQGYNIIYDCGHQTWDYDIIKE